MLSNSPETEASCEQLAEHEQQAGPTMRSSARSGGAKDATSGIVVQQHEQQAAPSTSSIVRNTEAKDATPGKVRVSATPDALAAREHVVRRRRLELDRFEFEAEKARKEIEFEERELEILRQFGQVGSSGQVEKTVAWLTETDRIGMATGVQRDGGSAGHHRLSHHPLTPTGSRASFPPHYDPTWFYDQRAAEEQEYAAWRCAVDNSFTKGRESHHVRQYNLNSTNVQNGGTNHVSSSPCAGLGSTELNQSHGNARHAIGSELPSFSGAISEWPIFYAHFKRSSAACGYTAEENFLRLQKALRGPALEAVEDLLLATRR